MFKRHMTALIAVCVVGIVFCSSAVAGAPAPGWQVFARTVPTDLPPGGEGQLYLYVYDIGTVASEAPTVVDTLPPGVEATGDDLQGASKCSGAEVVTCTAMPGYGPPAPGGGEPTLIRLPIKVGAQASSGPRPLDRVTVSGGGASKSTTASFPVDLGSEVPGVGFSSLDAWFGNADGTLDTQAGSHPYDLTVAFGLNANLKEGFYAVPAGGEAHYINVNFPPGIVGDPTAVPQCTREQIDNFTEETCPPSSWIGEDTATIEGVNRFQFKVYNMVPPAGVAAQFAFNFGGVLTFLDARVRSGGDSGITEHAAVPSSGVSFNSTTIWGVPAEHNGSGLEEVPFLTLPTSCQGPQEFTGEINGAWQNESIRAQTSFVTQNNEGEPAGLTGCERMQHFEPTVSIAPDTSFSDTPAGLSATVKVPQGLNPEGLATSGLKETTVTLPEGVVINPGQATGLVACQPAQEDIGGPEAEKESEDGPPSCPAASKVGTDEISTPLLPNRLEGQRVRSAEQSTGT